MSDLNHQPILSQKQIDSVISLYSNGQYQEAIDAIKLLNQSYTVNIAINILAITHKIKRIYEGVIKYIIIIKASIYMIVCEGKILYIF